VVNHEKEKSTSQKRRTSHEILKVLGGVGHSVIPRFGVHREREAWAAWWKEHCSILRK
jgi:hypothetical protein